jgi:hypothetical protein
MYFSQCFKDGGVQWVPMLTAPIKKAQTSW